MKDCIIHGKGRKRDRLDEIMGELSENQGGVGRHKCPYCAYEKGFRDAIAKVKGAFAKVEKGVTTRTLPTQR